MDSQRSVTLVLKERWFGDRLSGWTVILKTGPGPTEALTRYFYKKPPGYIAVVSGCEGETVDEEDVIRYTSDLGRTLGLFEVDVRDGTGETLAIWKRF